jgi:hypothetical protein
VIASTHARKSRYGYSIGGEFRLRGHSFTDPVRNNLGKVVTHMISTRSTLAGMVRRGLFAATVLTMVVSSDASAGWKKPPKKHKPDNKPVPQKQLGAPEIDPSLLAGGALLIIGGTLVLLDRKRAPQS